jgi:hypothetical protein
MDGWMMGQMDEMMLHERPLLYVIPFGLIMHTYSFGDKFMVINQRLSLPPLPLSSSSLML